MAGFKDDGILLTPQTVTPVPAVGEKVIYLNSTGDLRIVGSDGTPSPVQSGSSTVINVKDFGATGLYSQNATAAISGAMDAILAGVINNPSTWDITGAGKVSRASLYFPAGTYKVTEENVFMSLSAFASRISGLLIVGDGLDATQIIFEPSNGGDRYLIKNNDPGFLNITFRDISFIGNANNSSFMLSTSSGGPQNYVFDRVKFGHFKYGIRLQGTDNNSEMTFHNCYVTGFNNTFLWSETSDQFLNYWFNGCTIQPDSGKIFRFDYGGNLHINGCSIILVSPNPGSRIFEFNNHVHAEGVQNFSCRASRFELRNPNVELIRSEWGTGSIAFEDCSMEALSYLFATPWTTMIFDYENLPGPLITFRNCLLQGKTEFIYGINSGYNGQAQIVYDTCYFTHGTDLETGFIFTPASAHSNAGSVPVVQLRKCRPRGFEFTAQISRNIGDIDLNWNKATRSITQKKYANLITAQRTSPLPAHGQETLIMPTGSVITRVRMYMKAGVLSSVAANTKFTVASTETSPTILLEAAPTNLAAGFNVDSGEIFFVCDTDQKRTIALSANANVDQATTEFLCVVEYLG